MIQHVFKQKGRRIWWGQYRLSGDTGEPIRVSLQTSDKRVAERKLAEIVSRAELERAGIRIAEPLKVAANKPIGQDVVHPAHGL